MIQLSIGTDSYVPQFPHVGWNIACLQGFELCEEPTLAEQLMEAVQNYKERMLRGPGALSQEEIEARIAEFVEKYKPEDGTAEEMSAFYERLLGFMRSLNLINNRELAFAALMGSHRFVDGIAATRAALPRGLPQ